MYQPAREDRPCQRAAVATPLKVYIDPMQARRREVTISVSASHRRIGDTLIGSPDNQPATRRTVFFLQSN
jgi:hypothetical protein